MIVDCAVYKDGRRKAGNLELEHAYEAAQDGRAGSFVWIGVRDPTREEFDSVAREFYLHELAVEDAIKAHQRPKIEEYDGTLFIVLKTAKYHDDTETVEFGEINLFVGKTFVISVRHGAPSALDDVRKRIESRPEMLRCGPGSVMHGIIDKVVDDYEPVLAGIEDDIEEVEEEVFSERRDNPTQRIYKLKREVLAMHRATSPLIEPLKRLGKGDVPHVHEDIREYFRDIYDHVARANDLVDSMRDMLNGILDANTAQVSVRQNDDMRRISAWVGIVAVPTLLAGIWGMNYKHMPELSWHYGYPMALAIMGILMLVLYRAFKRAGWL
ncbi:MAG: magnesium transporter [Thermoleophilaceae bacterium]|jgi:magnesium transporter|nr:magnesium transporter [Thermoleophilaceae bacterium]